MLVVLLWNLSSSRAESTADNSQNSIQKSLNIEETPEAIRDEFLEMLSNCDDETLTRLSLHRDDGTSLFAAWEGVLRRCLATHLPGKTTLSRQEVDRNMAWFLGFLEGRLGIRAPDWWRHSLQQARLDFEVDRETGEGVIFGLSFEYPGIELIPATPRILVDSSIKVTMADDFLQVEKKGLDFSVPKALVDTIDDSQEIPGKVVMLAERCDDTSVILVMHGLQLGDTFLIARFSLESKKVLWKRKVRLTVIQMGGLSGPGPWHRISLHIDSDRVVLFGAATTGVFVSSFAKQDGVRNSTFFTSE